MILLTILCLIAIPTILAVLTYPYWISHLLNKLLKKHRFKMKMKGYRRISRLSMDTKVMVSPIWDYMFLYITGITVTRVKHKIVVKIDELRLRLIYNNVEIDYVKHNMIGVDKKEMGEAIHGNLLKILEVYEQDKAKFQHAVDKKYTKAESSLDKLKKRLSILQVLKKYAMNTVWIVFFRCMEIQVNSCIMGFDKKADNPNPEVVEKDRGKYNAYFNPSNRKVSMRMQYENVQVTMEHGPVKRFYAERQRPRNSQRFFD